MDIKIDKKKNKLLLMIIVLFSFSFFSFGLEMNEKNRKIIEEFMRDMVHLEIENIGYVFVIDGTVKEPTSDISPAEIGDKYIRYTIHPKGRGNACLCLVKVSEKLNKVVSFSINDQNQQQADIKEARSNTDKKKLCDNRWTREEGIKKVEPIIQYLGIENSSGFSPPLITEYNNKLGYFLTIKRDVLLDGVPYRYRGFFARVSLCHRNIESFNYSPHPSSLPKNHKPEGDCPVDKVKEVAREWLKLNEGHFYKRNSPYLKENADIKLVIAPGYNRFLDTKDKWIDKNFYYVWEVPFTFWEPYLGVVYTPEPLHKKGEEIEGVLWIEVESLKVIGGK